MIFGMEFTGAVENFKVLLVGLIFCSMLFIFQSFIASESKSYIVTVAPAILMICTIAISMKLIPEQGALGAAYSWGISHAIASVISGVIAFTLHIRQRKPSL